MTRHTPTTTPTSVKQYGYTTMKKRRKTRSDKGTVQLSKRDIYCLAWIADQYAIRRDQIQRLLSRWPRGKLKDKSKGLAETTVKDQIDRWKRAGWIMYDRVLDGQPGWAWITKKGLQVIGWDNFYTARTPAFTRLNHIYAVNQIRLFLDMEKDISWKPEREYRVDMDGGKKGRSIGPIPDAILISDETGEVAIEVEISAKKPDDMRKKLKALVDFDDEDFQPVFSEIWFYVPNERIKKLVENARGHLREWDQRRVSVTMQQDLLP